MLTPGSIFINALVLLTASLYWLMSGHAIPAILGYLFVVMYALDEKLYFLSDIVAIVTLLAIIVYFYLDYSHYEEQDSVAHFGIAVIYMLVIYFKTREIFDNE